MSPKTSSFPSLPDMSPKKVSATHNVYVSPLRSSKVQICFSMHSDKCHLSLSNVVFVMYTMGHGKYIFCLSCCLSCKAKSHDNKTKYLNTCGRFLVHYLVY